MIELVERCEKVAADLLHDPSHGAKIADAYEALIDAARALRARAHSMEMGDDDKTVV
jgi:hypothetical protein